MARYFVGSGTLWSDTASWATTDGGTSGASVPVSTDDVFLTASSPGNLTIDIAASCQSLTCTGFTHTLTHNAAITLSVGSSTAGAANVALLLVAGMTYTLGSTSTSVISFVSTNATQQTVTTGGQTMGSLTFNGVGGSWQLQDSLNGTNVTACALTLTNGSLDTNGVTITNYGILSSSNSNTRSLTLGASSITLAGNGNSGIQCGTSTNMTLNAGTSSITMNTSNSGTAFGTNLSWWNVTVNYGNGSGTISGSGSSFNNLTLEGGNQARLPIGADFTVNGTLSIISVAGNSTNVPICFSSTAGTQRTFTVSSAPTISNCVLQDIVISGPGTPYATTRTGDGGNNSGLTLSSPRVLYFVNNGATNYNSTSSWSLSSGGASGQDPPMPQDIAIFDNNSIRTNGRSFSISWQGIPSLDFSNLQHTPTVTFTNTNGFNIVFGNLRVTSAVKMAGSTTFMFKGRSDQTLDFNGIAIANGITNIDKPGATLKLLSDFVTTGNITFNGDSSPSNLGTLDANGFNVTCAQFNSNNSVTRTINMGSGTWTVTGTGNVWNTTNTAGLTFNAQTSTIQINEVDGAGKVFGGGSLAYNNLTIIGGGTGDVTIQGNNTFNTFTVQNPKTIKFTAGGTTTMNFLNANGVSGSLVYFRSTINGYAYNTNVLSGYATSFIDVQDSNASGSMVT